MKKLLIVILILGIAAFVGYKYVYQSHRDIQEEKAEFTVDATDLAREFSESPDTASKKYLNKTIIVKGEVTEIETNSLMLSEAAYCTFDTDHNITTSSLRSQYTIKGRCIGYDELLEVVKLDQTSIIK
ncbi:OB-fold protein [Aquimarina sp. LLG6339-5]|uniref:OB-fold protein n=1 Tax=Aquimarina sp. LLG6339-5 TaxID=3160830 RepID=UPI00386FE57B